MDVTSSYPAQNPSPTGPGSNPAPRLQEAGIDVTAYDPPALTPPIWGAIEERVLAVRGYDNRWELACALPQRCGQRLEAGESAEQVLAWLRHSAVSRLLQDRRSVRMAVIDSSLPLPLVERVATLQRRLGRWSPGRLRRAERDRALVQCCEDWAARLAGGTHPETLLHEPVQTQVRQLRNEQWGQRSWLSRLVGRCRQAVTWTLLSSGLVYALLWVRLALLQPRSHEGDLLDALDQVTRQIPVEQRAWPLVKRFSESENSSLLARSQLLVKTALTQGPSHPNWPQAREQLAALAEFLELLVEASRKPHLGYLYRDWPQQANLLPNVQVAVSYYRWQLVWLSTSLQLLQGESHRALEQSAPDRAADMAIAALRLARLAARQDNSPTLQELGEGAILQIVDQMGQLGESGQLPIPVLDRLRDALAEPQPESTPVPVDVDQILADQLDRCYSTGENGAITRPGLELLVAESYVAGGVSPVVQWMWWPWLAQYVAGGGNPFASQVQPLGPVIAPLMIRRQAARAELQQRVAAARRKAESSDDFADFDQYLADEVTALTDTDWSRLHYSPVIATLQSSAAVLREVIAPAIDTRRRRGAEGALAVRLALARHRQRTGVFPESLSALVPVDLPELPRDPFDGQPLRARRQGDWLILYSVGENGSDETAGWTQSNPQRPVHPQDLKLGEVNTATDPVPLPGEPRPADQVPAPQAESPRP